MENISYEQQVMKYRQNLINKGKLVNFENPDKLSADELVALTEKIFSQIDEIDCAKGYEHYDTGIRRPASISEEEQKELFFGFVDWYQVIETPSQDILDYVLQHYPVKKYPKILCVGDGRNCHLGRKLAMEGYKVVSVDPVARKVFSGKFKGQNGKEDGSLRVIQGEFFKTSTNMIDWANVIVGTKIPLCVEDLVQVNKPTVFNISGNPEIYHMRFRGVPITSEEQFVREISKCPGVELKKGKKRNGTEEARIIFVRDQRQKEDEYPKR